MVSRCITVFIDRFRESFVVVFVGIHDFNYVWIGNQAVADTVFGASYVCRKAIKMRRIVKVME